MDHTPAQAEPDPDHRRAIDPGTPLPRETRTWWHSTLSIAVALVIAVAALYVVNLLARPLALLALAIVISSALAPRSTASASSAKPTPASASPPCSRR